jgi:hypothetical protein
MDASKTYSSNTEYLGFEFAVLGGRISVSSGEDDVPQKNSAM